MSESPFDAAYEMGHAAGMRQCQKSDADLAQRITDYLSNGGLWNPEMADHDKVRDLLIDCRDSAALEAQFREKAVEVLTECRRVLGPAEMHTLNEATCISIDAVLALHAEIETRRALDVIERDFGPPAKR